jgi:flagellar biosynthesis/type III secretory pathway chaperone
MEETMTDRRYMLLVELENLQTQRRNAVEAYMSTGDRTHWREVREVSQSIADRLRELEEARQPAAKGDSLDEAIEELMVVEQ